VIGPFSTGNDFTDISILTPQNFANNYKTKEENKTRKEKTNIEAFAVKNTDVLGDGGRLTISYS
jgi:hypothetical protein